MHNIARQKLAEVDIQSHCESQSFTETQDRTAESLRTFGYMKVPSADHAGAATCYGKNVWSTLHSGMSRLH